MLRRQALCGALGLLCLGACTPLSASWAGSTGPAGASRAKRSPTSTPAIIDLEVKPVGETGALARTTGHCDLDGVVAARGSHGLARRPALGSPCVIADAPALAHGNRQAPTCS